MDNTNLDVDKLLHALDNENNSSIVNLTTAKIKSAKNDILQKLQLPREKLKELHTKLSEYRVVNDIDDIEYGRYIRWISLKDPSKIIDNIASHLNSSISEKQLILETLD